MLNGGLTEWCYDGEGLERFTTQLSVDGCRRINDYEIDELYADLDDFELKLEEPPYFAVWFNTADESGDVRFSIFYEALNEEEQSNIYLDVAD